MPTFIRLGLALMAALLTITLPAQAEGSPEAEARSVFVKLVSAAKGNQLAEFKKLIAKVDLQEMEALEKERSGFFKMMMGVVGAEDPKDFSAESQGNAIIFTKHKPVQTPDMSSSQTTRVTLIREGKQWKFGKADR